MHTLNVYPTTNTNTKPLCSVVADEVLLYSTQAEKHNVDETSDGSGFISSAGCALQTHPEESANMSVAVLVSDVFPLVSECITEVGRHASPIIQLVKEPRHSCPAHSGRG